MESASGYNAGMADRSTPLVIGIAGGSAGLDPVDVKTLHSFSGVLVDSATKMAWVDQARLAGGQKGRVDGGVTQIETDMVLVEGGEFTMGSTDAEVEAVCKMFGKKKTFNAEACRMEGPQRKVKVKRFYIDRYEVTHAQYHEFILATGHKPPPGWSGPPFTSSMNSAGFRWWSNTSTT